MKKFLLFIFLFASFAFKSNAQVYHPMLGDSCKWNCLSSYVYNGNQQPQYTWFTNSYRYKFNNDTIINSKLYKIIDKVRANSIGFPDSNVLFLREDSSSRIVYFLDTATEKIYYNFNFQIGDSVKIKNVFYHVIKVDSIFTLQGYRKQIAFDFLFLGTDTLKWIEGVGSNYGVHYLGEINDFFQSGSGYLFGLLCSWENTQQTFQGNFSGLQIINCIAEGGTVGINYLPQKISIEIFPNPTSSSFTIKKSSSEILQLHLYNLIGQNMLNENLQNETTQIERNQLPASTYLFSITSHEGKIVQTGKIVFE